MPDPAQLYDQFCSFENLHEAYCRTRAGKRYRDYALRFGRNAEGHLLELRRDLVGQTYRHGQYRTMVVADSKKRLIKVAPFRDRIVHHALCRVIEPVFERGFIYDSYACRIGKGTHRALERLRGFLRQPGLRYCLQGDVHRYFASIDHAVLRQLIARKIRDPELLWLVDEIICSSWDAVVHEDLFSLRRIGIPIGNLTSQLFANLYLNELDQFVKHGLRVRHYLRYMDDFLILGPRKTELHSLGAAVVRFLRDRLRLRVDPRKMLVRPVASSVSFLGYRCYATHRLLRTSTVRRFVRRVRGAGPQGPSAEQIRSWLDYASYARSRQICSKLRRRLAITLLEPAPLLASLQRPFPRH